MQLIQVTNLTKTFISGNGTKKTVLDNVTLSFPESGLYAIIGKSGSGKSTLLNLLSLMDKPTSGKIVFNKKDIRTFKNKRVSGFRNSDIGFVFQHYHLLENQTVLFNIMLPELIKGTPYKDAKEKAISLIRSIRFNETLLNKACKDLSGGEKERVAILRALINNPKVIFADEPTGALDSKNSVLVMKLFKSISKDRLVIIVTHNVELIKEYTKNIVTIVDGKVKKGYA